MHVISVSLCVLGLEDSTVEETSMFQINVEKRTCNKLDDQEL